MADLNEEKENLLTEDLEQNQLDSSPENHELEESKQIERSITSEVTQGMYKYRYTSFSNPYTLLDPQNIMVINCHMSLSNATLYKI